MDSYNATISVDITPFETISPSLCSIKSNLIIFFETGCILYAPVPNCIPADTGIDVVAVKPISVSLSNSKMSSYFLLLSSAIKFFPWQLGHIGAIRSAYQADTLSIFLSTSAGILFLIFLLMGLLRKDKRHPADLLTGTQVRLKHQKQL